MTPHPPSRVASGRANPPLTLGAPVTRQPAKGPEFIRYFAPLLDALRSLGNSGTPTEVLEKIAVALELDDSKQNETLASGQSWFYNQVHWARFYLTREGLLDGSERGVWKLAECSNTRTIRKTGRPACAIS